MKKLKHIKERVDFINDNDPYGEENWEEPPPFRKFDRKKESVDDWLKSIGLKEEEISRLTEICDEYVKKHKESDGLYHTHSVAQMFLFQTMLPYIGMLADQLNLDVNDRNTLTGVIVLNKLK